MCDPDTDEGEWVAMIDLVESNSELKLVDMDMVCQLMSVLMRLRLCDGRLGGILWHRVSNSRKSLFGFDRGDRL